MATNPEYAAADADVAKARIALDAVRRLNAERLEVAEQALRDAEARKEHARVTGWR